MVVLDENGKRVLREIISQLHAGISPQKVKVTQDLADVKKIER